MPLIFDLIFEKDELGTDRVYPVAYKFNKMYNLIQVKRSVFLKFYSMLVQM
jgi:hypothetical protein